MKLARLLRYKEMQKLILILVISFFVSSYTSEDQIRQTVYPNLYDGKYDSEFPYRSGSDKLEDISNTIKLINSIAFYRSYHFEKSDEITIESIKKGKLKNFLASSTSFEETASGTSTLIYLNGTTAAILTCDHIINFPDSIETFYISKDGRNTGFLRNFSVIVKQDIYVVPFFEDGTFELIARDENRDIAILKKELKTQPVFSPKAFNYPLGNADELNWGTFVYVFGYPANYKMISKGIVSNPNYDKNSSFLLDAVANQGMSGGIVLAIRDGVPNFELVGMVLSAPATFEYTIRPYEENPLQIGSEYTGPFIADSRKILIYGITRVLSIESIMEFIEDNSDVLMQKGINPNELFN